jgi:UDPglucose 6-dehydrogenase
MGVAEAATKANEEPVRGVLQQIEAELGGVAGKVIAVWGLAFKPRTDDVREAPALKLIEHLVNRGASVRATDPQARETAHERLVEAGVAGKVELFEDYYEACRGADALVIATEWNQYRSPDFERVRELMRGRHLFDGRNCVVPESVRDAGLRYRGMGRPAQG